MQLEHAHCDYRRACELLNLEPTTRGPRERVAQIPTWLQTELLAGDGERKLRAWSAQTSPPWTVPRAADILMRLHAFGDVVIASIVAEVLAGLPAPVVDHIIANTTIEGIGVSMHGWCGPVPNFGGRPYQIAVSAANGTEESIRSTAAEEIAHAWLCDLPAPGVTASSALVWSVHAHAEVPDDLPATVYASLAAYRREDDRQEKLAADLMRVWGFERHV